MIGTTLSHFKITAKLGEGGMGEVYLAEDTKLGREVAIKVLPAALTADPERRLRFEREAQAAAALDPRSWEGWPAVTSRITSLLELAQLQDEIGDIENARRHYQEYLDHWGDADPPVVAAAQARARLAEL